MQCTDSHLHAATMDTSGSTRSLSWWPIFSLLDASFLKKVKMACVFGSTGNEALVVTQGDEVYALGSNSSSCLGLGDLKSSFQPRKVDTLCKQGGWKSETLEHLLSHLVPNGEMMMQTCKQLEEFPLQFLTNEYTILLL